MNEITLTLGDWSDDGHGKTYVIGIKCNLAVEQLASAYEQGTKIVGLDFEEDVCRDYEDSSISEEDLAKLVRHGYSGTLEKSWRDEGWHLDFDRYAEIWLFIAKLGNPELKWEHVIQRANINIGGYGLFYS